MIHRFKGNFVFYNIGLALIYKKTLARGPKSTKTDILGGHFGFRLLAKNADIFGRGMEANLFIKGLMRSNQSSNLTSQRMVTELRFLTLLLAYEANSQKQ